MFVAFFAGERAKMKVVKIYEAFRANLYPFPDDLSRQWQMTEEVSGHPSAVVPERADRVSVVSDRSQVVRREQAGSVPCDDFLVSEPGG